MSSCVRVRAALPPTTPLKKSVATDAVVSALGQSLGGTPWITTTLTSIIILTHPHPHPHHHPWHPHHHAHHHSSIILIIILIILIITLNTHMMIQSQLEEFGKVAQYYLPNSRTSLTSLPLHNDTIIIRYRSRTIFALT